MLTIRQARSRTFNYIFQELKISKSSFLTVFLRWTDVLVIENSRIRLSKQIARKYTKWFDFNMTSRFSKSKLGKKGGKIRLYVFP